jgi:FixJ family two-component response regulator
MSTRHVNIYVVDDDDAVRRSLGTLLVSRGHAVRTFASGEDFLASADLQRGGCVVMDLRMPGLSGLQVLDELHARRSGLAVVFLSGHGDIALATQALKQAAVDWLEKPCDEVTLLAAVDRALARSAEVAGFLSRWQQLTDRERQVGCLMGEGLSTKKIARVLGIKPRTVDTFRVAINAAFDTPAQLATLLERLRSMGIALDPPAAD